MTRCAPNSVCRPSVTRKTPPSLPTFFAEHERFGVVCQDVAQCRVDGLLGRELLVKVGLLSPLLLLLDQLRRLLLEHVVEHVVAVDRAGALHLHANCVDRLLCTLLGFGPPGLVGDELSRHVDRVGPEGALFFERAISAGVVARGVRAAAIGEGFDDDRSVLASVLEGDLRCRIHLAHVVAINAHRGHRIPGRTSRDTAAGHLQVERGRERPAVVLHEEYDRRLRDRGEVHGLVHVALARCSVAEVRDGRAAGAVELLRVRPAHRVQRCRTDDRLQRRVSHLVRVCESAVPERQVAAHVIGQIAVEPHHDAVVAVGDEGHVASAVECHGTADLRRLLPDGGRECGQDALALPAHGFGVENSGDEHALGQAAQGLDVDSDAVLRRPELRRLRGWGRGTGTRPPLLRIATTLRRATDTDKLHPECYAHCTTCTLILAFDQTYCLELQAS